jgi:hypothetical protein
MLSSWSNNFGFVALLQNVAEPLFTSVVARSVDLERHHLGKPTHNFTGDLAGRGAVCSENGTLAGPFFDCPFSGAGSVLDCRVGPHSHCPKQLSSPREINIRHMQINSAL